MEKKQLNTSILLKLNFDINKAIELGRKHIEENHCDKTKEEQSKIFLKFVVDHAIADVKLNANADKAD